MKAETKIWLALAEEDFANAKLLWENRRYGATIFFSQQAVEKLLKSYIIEFRRKLPSKTHRIENLLKEAKLSPEGELEKNAPELSKAYIRVRYPDLNKQYFRSRQKVEPLYQIAKELYLWIKKEFKNH